MTHQRLCTIIVHNLFLHLLHTEDDTFEALRRIPFKQMREKMVSVRLDVIFVGRPTSVGDEILKANGWTREDYDFEVRRSFLNAEGLIIKVPNSYKVSHDKPYLTKYRG